MAALENYIKRLQDPAPEFRDPEDVGDETAARLAPQTTRDDDDDDASSRQPSTLRRRAAASLCDMEGGRKTSRKELYGEEEEEEEEEEESASSEEGEAEMEEEEGEESGGDEEEEEVGEMFDNDDGDDDDEGRGDDDAELEEEESGDDYEKSEEEEEDETQEGGASDEEITSADSEEETVVMKQDDDAVDQKQKAYAVVQQLDLWDRLMEARIQLQKVMSQVNRLPPSLNLENPHLSKAKDALVEMIYTLNNVTNPPSNPPSSPMKRKADIDVEELSRQSYESMVSDRNRILTFWDEKTRLASKRFKSFKSFQTPVVKQVEQILSDRDRLVRRTRVIRDGDGADLTDIKPEEVFDDNDFYQRLLKNVIERKSSDVSSVSASASHWLEVQRLRGKKKKKKDVDTRASKGRKLRYNVHSKMVNFMIPKDESTWSDNAKSELFKNLFKMPSHTEL